MTTPKNSEVHALLRLYFIAFLAKVFATLHPGKELDLTWYIEAMCYQLELVRDGDTTRLIINVPPRTLKSITVSVAWPAFLLGHDPTLKIMVVSHSTDLATDLSNKFRQIVEADWYREVFPTMSGAPRKDNERVFETSVGGRRDARSVNANILGMGADLIIVDDPLDPGEMTTQLAEERVNLWLDEKLSTRLNNPARSPVVLVMQRLSVNDPVAHMSASEHWDKLVLPAIAPFDIEVPIGPDVAHLFRQGDLLDPERLPIEILETQKSKMGTANYQAQYLQAPVPDGGGMVDLSLFQRYDTLPREFDVRFLSVDAASGSQSGSYSVILVFQITDGRLYLADCHRGYWSFPELKIRVEKVALELKAELIVIEKASNGEALLEVLDKEFGRKKSWEMLVPWPARKAKDTRMAKAMISVEKGKVLLPRDATWLATLETELAAFPSGKHDDQVDALSQGILFFEKYPSTRYSEEYRESGRAFFFG